MRAATTGGNGCWLSLSSGCVRGILEWELQLYPRMIRAASSIEILSMINGLGVDRRVIYAGVSFYSYVYSNL